LVRDVLTAPRALAIVQIRRQKKNGGHNVLARHLLNLVSQSTGLPVEDQNLPAMIDNWSRLGLVEVAYDTWLSNDSYYSWVEQRPEYIRLKSEPQIDGVEVTYQKGVLMGTELGNRFASAIGLQQRPAAQT